MTTKHQAQLLVHEINMWTRILDVAAETAADMGRRIEEVIPTDQNGVIGVDRSQLNRLRVPIFGGIMSAHMVTIALKQIDQHADYLMRSEIWQGDVANKGSEFRRAMRSEQLRDLRDVLEHAADYLTGNGRKPDLVAHASNGSPGTFCVNGRISTITAFGRTYNIENAITAAIAFSKALSSSMAVSPISNEESVK